MQGHPTPAIPWVDVATGSLGQGLPIGVGVALAGKYLDKLPYRCLGALWRLAKWPKARSGKALDKAGHYQLDNLIAIIDMNRLGQRGVTEYGWDGDVYAARARAFGWHAIQIDGHDYRAIDRALQEAVDHTGARLSSSRRRSKARAFRRWKTQRLARQGAATPPTPTRRSPSWAARPT